MATALKQEAERGHHLYLVPIQIGGVISETNAEWAKKLQEERVILDFSFEPDSKEYYQGLLKLVSGLLRTERVA